MKYANLMQTWPWVYYVPSTQRECFEDLHSKNYEIDF